MPTDPLAYQACKAGRRCVLSAILTNDQGWNCEGSACKRYQPRSAPTNDEEEDEMPVHKRTCRTCEKEFLAGSGNARYCPDCNPRKAKKKPRKKPAARVEVLKPEIEAPRALVSVQPTELGMCPLCGRAMGADEIKRVELLGRAAKLLEEASGLEV